MSDSDIDKDTATVVEKDRMRAEGVEPSAASEDEGAGDQELELLRSELLESQQQVTEARAQAEEMRDKFLRARADLENYRRRVAQDVERAREAGIDSAILTVLNAYDDLGRALSAGVDEPSKLIPGLESVLSSVRRNLETLGIKEVGAVGEPFDPDEHEALTAVPTDDPDLSGTIAEVYQTGFRKGERLVRPARVVVYQS